MGLAYFLPERLLLDIGDRLPLIVTSILFLNSAFIPKFCTVRSPWEMNPYFGLLVWFGYVHDDYQFSQDMWKSRYNWRLGKQMCTFKRITLKVICSWLLCRNTLRCFSIPLCRDAPTCWSNGLLLKVVSLLYRLTWLCRNIHILTILPRHILPFQTPQ